MGWKDSDNQTYFELTDPDGDKIFEGTLTVKTPGFNAFEYRYRFLRTADKSWGEEPAGFAKNAYRVRFIAQTGKNKFVQPYTAPVDKWTNKEDKSDQVEKFPTGYDPTDIEELNTGIPTKYSLDQNYPNPFNPVTKIKFSIPAEENVSLKVFNVLGQEVAILVNKQMKAGSYSFDWNASNLSSGVYFYRIEAGSFNLTKKMLLLK
ncbi:MAG: T9SS C-terminal target domain-containing protein [Stygiobacter sp.]|nr:MAG: T9SS C-terminal target domain-containing protein [Stygiobacter sp.]